MAQSRIEKFREYRKSIINDGDTILKTQIETSLETTSTESKISPTDEEAVFLKKVVLKKRLVYILTLSFAFIVVIIALIFGIILFK